MNKDDDWLEFQLRSGAALCRVTVQVDGKTLLAEHIVPALELSHRIGMSPEKQIKEALQRLVDNFALEGEDEV